MALVDAGIWVVSFSFRDNNGNSGITGVYLDGDLAQADAVDDATAIANAMIAASDARLETVNIARTLRNDDATAPPNTSEVERKLVITLGDDTYPNLSRVSLPSPIFAMEQPRTDTPDPNNAAYAALVTALTGGVLTPGTGATSYRGDPLTRVTGAKVSHRNRKTD